MGAFFAAMRAEIEAEGGTVEKFIGDAVMAAFGVPRVHEDDPARALRAALRMRRRLADLNEELGARYGVALELRIGINTGPGHGRHRPAPGRGARDRRCRQRRRAHRAGRGAGPGARRRAHGAGRAAFPLRRRARARGARPARAPARRRAAHRSADHRGHALGHARAVRRPPARARAAVVDVRPRRSQRDARTSSRSTARPASARAGSSPSCSRGSRPGRRRPASCAAAACAYGAGISFWPLAEMLKEHAQALDTDPRRRRSRAHLGRRRGGVRRRGRGRAAGARSDAHGEHRPRRRRAFAAQRAGGARRDRIWPGAPSSRHSRRALRRSCSSRTCTGPTSRCSTCSRTSRVMPPGRSSCCAPRGPS